MLINPEFFRKNKDRGVRVLKESDLSEQEQAEFSAMVSALVGGGAGRKETSLSYFLRAVPEGSPHTCIFLPHDRH
jgi:hypothetical protein